MNVFFTFRSEQLIFFRAENRLLYNYLIWYEKKIIQNREKRNSTNTSLASKSNIYMHIQFLNKIFSV